MRNFNDIMNLYNETPSLHIDINLFRNINTMVEFNIKFYQINDRFNDKFNKLEISDELNIWCYSNSKLPDNYIYNYIKNIMVKLENFYTRSKINPTLLNLTESYKIILDDTIIVLNIKCIDQNDFSSTDYINFIRNKNYDLSEIVHIIYNTDNVLHGNIHAHYEKFCADHYIFTKLKPEVITKTEYVNNDITAAFGLNPWSD